MRFPRRYSFMGRRGCVVGEVEFENCRVPAANLLGAPDEGARIMSSMFNFERIILGGSAFRATPELYKELGTDGVALDVRGALRLAATL